MVRISTAFPPLVEDIIVLLLQLARVALSQASLVSHVEGQTGLNTDINYDNPMQLCDMARETFKEILKNAVLKNEVY